MNGQQAKPIQPRAAKRKRQEALLRDNGNALQAVAQQGDQEAFFQEITPLLGPLRSYIARRLTMAYANGEISKDLYTSSDLLDVILNRGRRNPLPLGRGSSRPFDC
jgi:hypothetical protein